MSAPPQGDTYSAAMRRARQRLQAAGVATAALDARVLMQAACDFSHEQLVMRGDDPLTDDQATRFDGFVTARACGKPVSRILGTREFWGLELAVTPATLDPRADTETLVEVVLARLGHGRRPFIHDMGTGTGAILLALLHALPGARGTGSDISFSALETARANARAVGVSHRASFVMSDWGQVPTRLADVLVSNPPYIARGELPGLMREVRGHDPARALDGGADGLLPYRQIAAQLGWLAKPGALLVFEIGPTQGAQVQAILAAAGAQARGVGLGVIADLAGRPRVVVARAPRH